MSFLTVLKIAAHSARYGLATLGVFGAVTGPAYATGDRTLELQENHNGRMMISTAINGQNALALIDTGATIPLIDLSYLGAEVQSLNDLPQANVLGVGGAREYPLTFLSELAIGSDRWSNVKVAVNSENRTPVTQPILPMNLFQDRVVDFDFVNRKLHLYNSRPRHVTDAMRSKLQYEMINGLLFIDISINGVSGKALIDTGADVTFATKSFSRAANGRVDEDETKRIRGSDLTASAAEIHMFRDFQVGKSKIARVHLPVIDTQLFRSLGVEHDLCLVIGMDFLQYFRLQIDREKQEISFVLAPPARASHIQRGNPAMSLRSIRRR